ncbi:MAG: hypothetical protein AAFU56_11205, partial [Pseudomonadota bacterium]
MRALLASLLIVLVLAPTSSAQSLDPAFVSAVKDRATTDPAEALALADAKLKELLGQEPRDILSIYSLLDFQRQLAVQSKDATRQAQVLMSMATLAQSSRQLLSTDPLPLLREAAVAYEKATNLREAQRAL